MYKGFALLILVGTGMMAQSQTITETFGSDANQFSMEFVLIGNPGNAADTTGSPNPAGSVSYAYNIGIYEVSRDMITKANAAGGLGISLQDMTSYGGNGVDRPAAGISWNEAARFVNWLNTSRGFQAAYNFTTSGANANITLWGAGSYLGSNPYRHKDAVYFLPSVDEWYKAAYGSPGGTWYNFTTGSDSAPTSVTGGTAAGTAVYGRTTATGPADINNAGGLSAFGVMAMGGNVWEWNEGAFDGLNSSATESRAIRGGRWDGAGGTIVPDDLAATTQAGVLPTDEFYTFGFRVASVPEPSAGALLLVGMAALLRRRNRK
jgi:hypothetical protein